MMAGAPRLKRAETSGVMGAMEHLPRILGAAVVAALTSAPACGLAGQDGQMHPVQRAFRECHGLQCGFCTPGMVLSAIDLVQRHPKADEKTILEELEGNLCRCTGYQNIVRAIQQGAAAMAK